MKLLRGLAWVADPFNLGRIVGTVLGFAVALPLGLLTILLFAMAFGIRLFCDGVLGLARYRADRIAARSRAWDRHPAVLDYAHLEAQLADIPFDQLRAHDKESTK